MAGLEKQLMPTTPPTNEVFNSPLKNTSIPYLYPMDKIALQKGLKRVFYAILAAFIGPVVIMQAFQNEGHPWYWPVLSIGLLFFCGAIGFGFWGIITLVNALLGKKRKG